MSAATLDLVELCHVDLFPASYEDARLMDWPELSSQAWNHFDGSERLRELIDSILERECVYIDQPVTETNLNVTEIVWRTPNGRLRMSLLNECICNLQAIFDPHGPCRHLALLVAALANMYRLCALSERGLIREADIMLFARKIQEHVVSLRIQSAARH